MATENSASTPVDELQKQRESREQQRAQERSRDNHRQLIAKGKESRTPHGVALMRAYGETLGVAIDALLTNLIAKPDLAGRHYGAWPLLLYFNGRGPRSIAAITLGVVVDKISQRPQRARLASDIGMALQSEYKALALHHKKGVLMLNALKKRFGLKTVSNKVLNALHIDANQWTQRERRELGLLLLEVIQQNMDLLQFTMARVPLVEPTAAALELIKANPPRPLPARSLPSLQPPEPWVDVVRGVKPLVTSRKAMDLSHINAKSCNTLLQVVNHLEQQPLEVDPWMLELQREAWDCNLPDVFSVQRDPEEPWKAYLDRAKRVRIEDCLRQFEEVRGLPIWLEHDADFRGRVYATSRVGGHQGPDHQKALISFAKRELVDDDAFSQMLSAAAGHYGLGRHSWQERLAWGRSNLSLLQAIAESPLDQFDLWRGASDPWQLVQMAKAIAGYLDGERLSGVPIRFDQTCSGLGIISALTRDQELATYTNVIGTQREDVYERMAAELLNQLRMDLEGFDFRDVRMAEFWLQQGIGRDLVKSPVMTTVYGSKQFGIAESLVAFLQEKNPDVPVARWDKEYTQPARYLARKFSVAIGARLKSCIELEKWLREVSKRCMKKQQRIRWISPLGFPIALGTEVDHQQPVRSAIHGTRRWTHIDGHYERGMLSAKATNRGVMANTIHTFDAAHCHAVVLRCAQVGVDVLTNHDAFAVAPAHADWLHHTLLDEFRSLYRPDWLAELRVEIGRNASVQLPHPPHVGSLCEGGISNNPYLFC